TVDALVTAFPGLLAATLQEGKDGDWHEQFRRQHDAADMRFTARVPVGGKTQIGNTEALLQHGFPLGGHIAEQAIAKATRLARERDNAELAQVVPACNRFHGVLLWEMGKRNRPVPTCSKHRPTSLSGRTKPYGITSFSPG